MTLTPEQRNAAMELAKRYAKHGGPCITEYRLDLESLAALAVEQADEIAKSKSMLPSKEKLNRILGGLELPAGPDGGSSDCLAIVIACYFESHHEAPDDQEPDDEQGGYTPWVLERAYAFLDAIVDEVWINPTPESEAQ